MKLSTFARSILETVRAAADSAAGPDDMLEFYSHALAAGASPDEAESIDEYLTVRIMRARGAL